MDHPSICKKNKHMLLKSVRLINPFIFAVVAAFFLEPLTIGLPVPAVVAMALAAAGAALKVILFSGTFGVLVDMAGGKEDSCTLRNFLDNARSLGVFYAMLAAGVLVLYLLFLLALPGWTVPLPVFQAAGDILFLYWMARRAIRTRYPHRASLAEVAREDIPDLAGVMVLWLFYCAVIAAAFLADLTLRPATLAMLFFAKYLQFLLFGSFVCLLLREDVPETAPASAGGRELVLVNPAGGTFFYKYVLSSFVRIYPAVFLVLRALTPASYRIREYNLVPWKKKYYRKDALVAVTCMTTNCAEAYQIARGFQRAGAKVVMGGSHVSLLPDEALEFCDSVVVGPAEGVWEEVVRDYENNALKRVYRGSAPAEKLEKVDQYLLTCPPDQLKDSFWALRGCKFSCDFCVVHLLQDGLIKRNPANLAALARRIRARHSYVLFLDDNLYADPAYMETVLKALEPAGLRWEAMVSIDVAQNDRMLDLMKKSGCHTVYIGYEISSGSTVSDHGGKLALARRYLELSRKLARKGFRIRAQFIFGFEEDTWKELWNQLKFSLRLFPDVIGLCVLQPRPGTAFFNKVAAENRITNLNWSYYSMFTMVYKHPRMSDAWLQAVLPVYFLVQSFLCSRDGLSRLVIIVLILFSGFSFLWLPALLGH